MVVLPLRSVARIPGLKSETWGTHRFVTGRVVGLEKEPQVPPLRSEALTFLISLVVRGRKAPKSICPRSIAGVLRLRAINTLICDRSARRFAQDDAFLEGVEKHLVGSKNTGRSKKSQALGMTKGRVALRSILDSWISDDAASGTVLRMRPHRGSSHPAAAHGTIRECGT